MAAASISAEFLAGLDHPEETQARTLLESVLRPNQDSEVGRECGFRSIKSPADYQQAVPIRTYEDLRPAIERMWHGEENVLVTDPVRRFFTTSGSMSAPKHIPVTSRFIRDKSRAFGVYWSAVFEQWPSVSRGRVVTNFSDSGETTLSPGGLPVSSEAAFWSRMTALGAKAGMLAGFLSVPFFKFAAPSLPVVGLHFAKLEEMVPSFLVSALVIVLVSRWDTSGAARVADVAADLSYAAAKVNPDPTPGLAKPGLASP